ncbi:hypothetical protein [Fusibacter sp. 3D3]|uniref:hypothetical protein n=1 Tax=Fusibacter sp. 3D3 TaxID=1048380 RepID=UPI000857EAC2|nr:hypothetical protein [Fusibacter sp. 3D3]GAU78835.1 hypothetical protein F3D3_3470 [Fusibacter sp. 3D3]
MKAKTSRKNIKKYGVLILLLFLTSNLMACRAQSTSGDEVPNPLPVVLPENTPESTPESTSSTIESMKNAYKSILEGIFSEHTFPGGEACDWTEDSDLSQNQFAVYDIDQDGQNELIIAYTNASLAGMVELIYDFEINTQTANEVFREFPTITYYDNGIVKAEWSHNQGLAGDFWPYTLYKYESESDQYANVGMVDAWDRSLSESNYEGNSFPSESDTDGDGIVYYIMQDGEYKLDQPIDYAEYEQWRDAYMNNAKEVTVPFVNLTQENIDNIE